MANIKALKDLTPGTVFDAGPIDVRVLDHMTNGTTLLIADKAVAWRPFSLEPLKTRPEAPTPNPNDFSLSYLKDELNGPFLVAFDAAGGPIRSANIVEADWSLADHRGGFGYGNMKAKISLLPEALFLKYPFPGGTGVAFGRRLFHNTSRTRPATRRDREGRGSRHINSGERNTYDH